MSSVTKKTFIDLIDSLSRSGCIEWAGFPLDNEEYAWEAFWNGYAFRVIQKNETKAIPMQIWRGSNLEVTFTLRAKREIERLQNSIWNKSSIRELLYSMREYHSFQSRTGGLGKALWYLRHGDKKRNFFAVLKIAKTIGIRNTISFLNVIRICGQNPEKVHDWAEVASRQAEICGECGAIEDQQIFMELAFVLRNSEFNSEIQVNESTHYQMLCENLAQSLKDIAEFSGVIVSENGENKTLDADWAAKFASETLDNLGFQNWRSQNQLEYGRR